MTAIARPSGATAPSPVPLTSRLFGLGSVFGKTIRDSRRATFIIAGLMAIVFIGVSKAIVSEFNTPESRLEIANLVNSVPPILQGFAGRPINVETLGGYLQYKYGTFFPIIVSLWSILALSGTLAGEARRGSMEFVAATAIARRRIAIEKLLGHVVMLTIAMVVVFVAVAIAGASFPILPGDEISVTAAAGYAIWMGLLALAAGGLAFAVAVFLGRGAAIGIAGAVMFAGFMLNGYQAAVPELAPLANLTWFGWTSFHLPLAGQFDWAPLGLVAIVALVLLAIGVESFARRDLAATSSVPTPSLPDWLVGLRGPSGRAFGESIPLVTSWAIGLGLFALVLAASAGPFVEELGNSPEFIRLLGSIFPGIDFATPGGFLQLLFVEFGLILAGLAAATLVGRWASDETSGRTEFLLATPLARLHWVVGGGLAVLAGVAVIVVITAVAIAIGAQISGGDVLTPLAGSAVLGFFALAMAGVGFAVGGLFGAALAGPVVALLTIVTWFIDIIAPALGLPDVVHELALSAHFGQPMVGQWDPVGIVASLVLAVGGLAIGAWGFARRDLQG